MGSVQRFEDLKSWQAGCRLVQQIYAVTAQKPMSRDRRFVSQIRAAAISVTSNIAEGFERGSAADFHKFLVTAKASCAEVRSQLYNARDTGSLPAARFVELLDIADITARLVGALREAVKRRIVL
jgi:four helix bundle protein